MSQEEIKKYIEKFKVKQTLENALENYQKMKKIVSPMSFEEKRGKGFNQAFAEISALVQLAQEVKADHLKWTGDQIEGNACDAIVYLNSVSQNIEFCNLVNPEEMKTMKKEGRYQMQTQSLKGFIRMNINLDSINEENYIEYFIYKKTLQVLKNKNNKKYKNFWLVIPYSPFFGFENLSDDVVKRYIFFKLEKENAEIVSSVRDIFNRIIFLPYKGLDDRSVSFEWTSYWYVNGFNFPIKIFDFKEMDCFFNEIKNRKISVRAENMSIPYESEKILEKINFKLIFDLINKIKSFDPNDYDSDYVFFWLSLAILTESSMKCFLSVYAYDFLKSIDALEENDLKKRKGYGIKKMLDFMTEENIVSDIKIIESIEYINNMRNDVLHNIVPLSKNSNLQYCLYDFSKFQNNSRQINSFCKILNDRLPF